MADNTIKIGGELESMATGKIVAAASAIKDKSRNKTQEAINGDVEAAIAEQSAQFEALSEETSAAVASASESARQAEQYLEDLQEAITDLPDGQAVSTQVAVNQTDIAGLKSKTDSISKQSTQSEEDAIIYETDGGTQVGKIDPTGADFANLKRGGQQVARMSDLPTKDNSIGENPSTTNVPTTKAVRDYVDANIPEVPDYPIETETAQSEAEEVIFGNDAGTQQYVKVSSEGVRAVAYRDMQGNNVIPIKDTSIGNNPSTTNVPTTKAVKDYVDANSGGDYPIDTETTSSEDEEQIWQNDEATQEYVKIGSYGMKAKAYLDMQGASIIDGEIGDTPSTTHAPSSKAVKDYVDEHVIPQEETQSNEESLVIRNSADTEDVLKVTSEGLRVKSIKDMDGNPIGADRYLTCWGDSITMGWQGRAYSEVLQDAFPNIKVYNCGVGGETNTTIMARLGAIATLIPNSFTLPASISQRVEIATDNNPLISSYDGKSIKPLMQGTGGLEAYSPRTKCNTVNPCYVGGIECTMEYDRANDKWYVKRNVTGDRDIVLPAHTSVIFNGKRQFSSPHAAVFFAYQNGGVDSAEDLVNKYKMMVKECKCNIYLVLNRYTTKDDTYESALQEAFGIHFFNVREYLSTNAMADLGLTPTTDSDLTPAQIAGDVKSDVYQMERGLVPSTFWACAYRENDPTANKKDMVHLNALGYQAMGNQMAKLFIAQGI